MDIAFILFLWYQKRILSHFIDMISSTRSIVCRLFISFSSNFNNDSDRQMGDDGEQEARSSNPKQNVFNHSFFMSFMRILLFQLISCDL